MTSDILSLIKLKVGGETRKRHPHDGIAHLIWSIVGITLTLASCGLIYAGHASDDSWSSFSLYCNATLYPMAVLWSNRHRSRHFRHFSTGIANISFVKSATKRLLDIIRWIQRGRFRVTWFDVLAICLWVFAVWFSGWLRAKEDMKMKGDRRALRRGFNPQRM